MILPNSQWSVLAVNPIKTPITVTAQPFNRNEFAAMRLMHSSIKSISLNKISLLSKLRIINTLSFPLKVFDSRFYPDIQVVISIVIVIIVNGSDIVKIYRSIIVISYACVTITSCSGVTR